MATDRAKRARGKRAESTSIGLTVNGQTYRLEKGSAPGEVDPAHTLAHTLRETLGLTGTKVSCDNGACGCCTVLMDGKAVLSCMTLTVECDGCQITTIEGLRDKATGNLDPLQQAFIDHTAFQCGFCTPGIIMSARALLDENPAAHRRRGERRPCGQFLQVHQPLPGHRRSDGGAQGGDEMTTGYRFIGKAVPRQDAADIVIGELTVCE